jgi:uridine phosphorylase
MMAFRDEERSAASPWKDGRPPHLPCRMGELPAAVLFPGDPGRVDRFASMLEGFRVVGQNREFRIGLGTFEGVELGVCSTGIGGPSTEIAMVEAAALDASIALGTLLVIERALRGGGAPACYAEAERPALADPRMVEALCRAAQAAELPMRRAVVASTDSYYAGQGRAFPGSAGANAGVLERYRAAGADALDMEAESVLAIGARLGLVCGAALAVHANRATDAWLEDFGSAQDGMIRVGCKALAEMVRGQR